MIRVESWNFLTISLAIENVTNRIHAKKTQTHNFFAKQGLHLARVNACLL
jgi:hypothetical protein